MACLALFLCMVFIALAPFEPVQSAILKSQNDTIIARNDIITGSFGQLILVTNRMKIGSPLFIHTEDVVYRGMEIKGIKALEIVSQGATATIVTGGVGSNSVTIRLKSERSKGYNYDVYIYG